jgi:hypothetical protein
MEHHLKKVPAVRLVLGDRSVLEDLLVLEGRSGL